MEQVAPSYWRVELLGALHLLHDGYHLLRVIIEIPRIWVINHPWLLEAALLPFVFEKSLRHYPVDVFETLQDRQSGELCIFAQESPELVVGTDHYRLLPEDVWGLAGYFELL